MPWCEPRFRRAARSAVSARLCRAFAFTRICSERSDRRGRLRVNERRWATNERRMHDRTPFHMAKMNGDVSCWSRCSAGFSPDAAAQPSVRESRVWFSWRRIWPGSGVRCSRFERPRSPSRYLTRRRGRRLRWGSAHGRLSRSFRRRGRCRRPCGDLVWVGSRSRSEHACRDEIDKTEWCGADGLTAGSIS